MRHVEAVLACVAEGKGSLSLPGGIDARMEFGTLSLRSMQAREQLVAGWLGVSRQHAACEPRGARGEHRGAFPQARAPLEFVQTDQASLLEVPGGAPVMSVAYVDAAALGYAERDPGRFSSDAADLPAEVLNARLWVDGPVAGDIMCPLGMHGRSKKVSDILGAARVPVAERANVPVVRTAPSGAVVWVGGIRLDDRFKCTSASKLLIKLVIRAVGSAEGASDR